MLTIAALILTLIIVTDCFTGGHLGFKKAISCLLHNKHSRWFMITGIVCAGILVVLLTTGTISVHDLLEQERLMVELCPLCM
jgi:hypothetical protein